MGNAQGDLINQLENDSNFTKEQLETMITQFNQKFPNGKLTRDEFLSEMSRISGSPQFWEGIYSEFDIDCNGWIDFQTFIMGLSFFNPQNSVREKLVFAFRMFDLDNNGVLDQNEITSLIQKIFTVASVSTKQKTTHMLNELQGEENVGISLEDFVNACSTNKEILQAIESCLLKAVEINTDLDNQDVEQFGHQAAGHAGVLKSGNTLLKKYSDQEFEIYEHLKNNQSPEVLKYFPGYFGRTYIVNAETQQPEHYIILEDLTEGMEKPCIMDIKMGRQTF